jgi:two-component system chemotaxis response regulator CheY
MHLLIADDEPSCRRAVELALEHTGHRLTFARDGAEAWWMLTDPEHLFDLGIFDVKMPSAGGIALARRIRATEKFRRLPVILCTGFADRTTVIAAAELGRCQFIVKPFEAPTLRDRIRRLLAEADPAQAPAA